MASKKLDYFLQPGRLPAIVEGVLVDVNANTVYTTIEAMLGTTAASFWDSPTDRTEAYNRIVESAASLLMDATDRLIRALWEIRGVPDATLTPTPLGLYPGPIEENELRSIWLTLADTQADNTANFAAVQNQLTNIEALLAEIRDASGGFTAEEKAELFARLLTIVTAL
jgi:hypothetical protein